VRREAGGIELDSVLGAPDASIAGNRRARDPLGNDRRMSWTPVRATTSGDDAIPHVDLELAECVLGTIVREP